MVNIPVIIVGAGPAGLAVGACLRKANIEFVMLDKAPNIASSWHNHYDRLHLHSTRKNSGLPHFPMPASYPKYPSRKQVVDYFLAYAQHFKLQPNLGEEVKSALRIGGKWRVKTEKAEYFSQSLVVASGLTCKPKTPNWPGLSTFSGPKTHSRKYRNGSAFAGKRVLVTGFGNSGGEIALDLLEHGAASVSMSVRSPVNIVPKEILGLNSISISIATQFVPDGLFDALTAPITRLRFGKLEKLGLRKATLGPRRQVKSTGRIPLIDLGTMKAIKSGEIKVYPGVQEVQNEELCFENGERASFDALIFATGYRPELSFLDNSSHFFSGNPIKTAPKPVGEAPDLYFCGLRNPATGALRGMNEDAQKICREIEEQRN